MPLVLQGGGRDRVHLADDIGLGEAVGQDPLPVADGLRVVQAGEQHLRGHPVQELVTGGHRLQQRGQLQVLDQVLVAGGQVGPEVEVPVLEEQVGLHEATLSSQPLVGQAVFLGQGQRVGQAVGWLPDHLVGAFGRVVRDDRAHHADHLLAERGQLVHEGDVDAQGVEPHDLRQQLRAQEAGIVQGGGGEDLVQHHDAAAGGRAQDLADPHQVVFQLPAQRGQVLLPLEMGEQPVGQEQPGGAARHRAADAGQVVELAEGPGEGGLASLVGAGHHEDALASFQMEVVGDHGPAPRDELAGQGQVEGAGGADLLRAGGDLGIAEGQAGVAKRPDVAEVGEVELEFLVGAQDALVGERGVPAAVLVQGGELLREQPGDPFEDLGGDVVDPRPRPVTDPVVLDRALLEALERLQHLGAVVGFTLVAAHLDPVAPDAGAVADLPEGLLLAPGIGRQGGEPGRGHVRSQVVPEGQQGAGADRRRGEVPGQGPHRVAVDGRRVQQPALPLVAVLHLRRAGAGGRAPRR